MKIVGRMMFVCQSVSQSVSQYVCPSTLVNSARTAGLIGMKVVPVGAPIRRNDAGADPGSIGGTWHVARAAPRRPAKRR